MAVKNDHHAMLAQLKKQIRLLEKREEQAKKKWQAAMTKLHQLSHRYKIKLAKVAHTMKARLAEVEASTYVKSAEHLERQLLQGVEARSKALAATLIQMEKKAAAKLKKSLTDQGKKAGSASRVRAAKVKKTGQRRSATRKATQATVKRKSS